MRPSGGFRVLPSEISARAAVTMGAGDVLSEPLAGGRGASANECANETGRDKPGHAPTEEMAVDPVPWSEIRSCTSETTKTHVVLLITPATADDTPPARGTLLICSDS